MNPRAGAWWIPLGLLAACLLPPASGAQKPTASTARVERTQGVVRVQREGRGAWRPIRTPADRLLRAGDHLQTLQRSAATVLIAGVRVRLGPQTHVMVPTPGRRPRGTGEATIRVLGGEALLWLISAPRASAETPAAVAAADATKFLIQVDDDGTTTLTVLEGEVSFTNDRGAVLVREHEQSVATPATAPSRPMRVDPSGYLEWEAEASGLWLGWETRYYPGETPTELTRRAEEAAADADAAPQDAEKQLRAGDLLHDLGDLGSAAERYRRATDLAPQDAGAWLRLGANLLQQALPREALAAFEAAAENAPTAAEPLVGQAAALASTGAPDSLSAARALLSEALSRDPAAAAAHLVAAVLDMRTGDARGAAGSLDRALAADPQLYQAHATRALVGLATGDKRAALEASQKAVALAPGSALAHESLATVWFFTGESEAAGTELALALAANPTSPSAHLLASHLLLAAGDLDGGLEQAQACVALDPAFGPAYASLGMIYLAGNDLWHAEASFVRALELSPNLVSAYTGLGATHARQGKLGAALEAQRAALSLDSKLASVHNNLGGVYLATGRLDEAVAAFSTALEMQPDWALAHANLAMAYLDQNRYPEALREAQLAVRLGEESARVHTCLARVYLKQSRVNRAVASLRRAIELDGDYAPARFDLGDAYCRLGRFDDALSQQLEAVATEPGAMVQTRQYARTEAGLRVGSIGGSLKVDGRGDHGRNSGYLAVEYEKTDGGRSHSDTERATALAIGGRQFAVGQTAALYLSAQHEEFDRPGRQLADGSPQDPNYVSRFDGAEAHLLLRDRAGAGRFTWRLGYRTTDLQDSNPDSLNGDPKPFPELRLRSTCGMVEGRYDGPPAAGSRLTVGAAWADERSETSGVVGALNPPGSPEPVRWTSFRGRASRPAATLYLEHQSRLGGSTDLTIGGRLAARDAAVPVLRPQVSLRHRVATDASLVLLTRPVLRDDVSELSPVDIWALGDWTSPPGLAPGGYTQSYELQYERMPADGSLLRLAVFSRDMHNLLVGLDHPRWGPGTVGQVVGAASLRGAEAEWEQWLGSRLSAGLCLRYVDSENSDSQGCEIPYVPRLMGQLRFDYMDRHGVRATAVWVHTGRRYADMANTRLLESLDALTVGLAKQFDLHTEAFITVHNVLDAGDGFWQGYPEPGRKLEAGVLYRF